MFTAHGIDDSRQFGVCVKGSKYLEWAIIDRGVVNPASTLVVEKKDGAYLFSPSKYGPKSYTVHGIGTISPMTISGASWHWESLPSEYLYFPLLRDSFETEALDFFGVNPTETEDTPPEEESND